MKSSDEMTTAERVSLVVLAYLARQFDNTVSSDDDNALEALEQKIERLQADQDRMKATNKIISRKPKNELTTEKVGELIAMGYSEVAARKLFSYYFCDPESVKEADAL